MLRKTILTLGTAVLLGAAGLAYAADLPLKARSMAPAPSWSWTGFYVGVNAGFGGDRTDYPFRAPTLGVAGSADLTSSGGLAGGQVGYNWQWVPGWVFGVEGDIDWANIESKLSAVATGPGVAVTFSAGTEVNWFATVRGRVGYTGWFDNRMMVYGTGGVAFGNTTTRLNAAGLGAAFAFSHDNDKSGWTAGAGVEFAFAPNLSWKTEYLYVDLGRDNVFTGAVGGVPFNIAEDTKFHLVRAGLNYRF
jgi:outer membrane immunogenic protein